MKRRPTRESRKKESKPLNMAIARKEFKEINVLIEEIMIEEIEPLAYEKANDHLKNYMKEFEEYYEKLEAIYKRCIEQEYVYNEDVDEMFEILDSQEYLDHRIRVAEFFETGFGDYVKQTVHENEDMKDCIFELMSIVDTFKHFPRYQKEHLLTLNMFRQIEIKMNNYLTLIIRETLMQYKDVYISNLERIEELCTTKMIELVRKYDTDEENIESIKKIFDQNDMEKFVLENGYKLSRQTGSHRIYTKENCKNVIIPMHKKELSKGLSIKIQKEVLEQA
jgi:predicted RNA binding protein YcfA (HicA-like mRNA interferase family)